MASYHFFQKFVLILVCTIAHSSSSSLSGLPIDNGHESSSGPEPVRPADVISRLLQKTVASPYISGGFNATKGQFPYHVSVQYSFSSSSYHICGGSIVSTNWVVTAAHCVSNFVSTPTSLRVLAGRLQLYTPDINEQIAIVQKVILHPTFRYIASPYSITGDIALLKLWTGLRTSYPTVGAIAIPYQNEIPDFTPNILHSSIGWGTLSSGYIPSSLRYGYTNIIAQGTCQSQLGYNYAVQYGQICSNPYSGIQACSGDEGGSLVPLYRTGKLVGIYSWRPAGECSSSLKPGVYTQVSVYSNWLLSTMATN